MLSSFDSVVGKAGRCQRCPGPSQVFPIQHPIIGGTDHVVNLGSVSNPVTSGLQATYVLVDADEHGYNIQLRRVDYDREAVIHAIEQSHHPTSSFLIGFMRGERALSSDPGFFEAGRRAKNQKEQ